ncbi:BrnT family toxin [Glaesserella parasuis]|uniref:BrnT family toxin n=1 Tax=Glaesserella parasuis TaxID=738 RepID=UPI0002CCA966|nr:BrnT family toxin [Glaesserella parasuis]EMY45293.1 hypothetical protein OE7_10518 [Glaesserella parasuis gx033]MDG6249137.1 BrnT family toxin [Glaesserella parasuis]MDG6264426.1 BrnT family toxin [Glaesserella parasuis]MDG6281280.1 BrnT family toxin [Glaesserella parasuis]MDG6283203.1 BrnT family toxin [Glaesserella parasuis]
MLINYDPNKSNKNITERGLSFDEVAFFEWKTAIIKQDERFDYPEPRFVAVGFLKGRLHVLCFTPIQNGVRVISFRKANKREVKHYEAIQSSN